MYVYVLAWTQHATKEYIIVGQVDPFLETNVIINGSAKRTRGLILSQDGATPYMNLLEAHFVLCDTTLYKPQNKS